MGDCQTYMVNQNQSIGFYIVPISYMIFSICTAGFAMQLFWAGSES